MYLVCGRSYMTVHTCQNSEYLKKVNLILCKLHFSKPDLEMKTYWMRFRDVFVVFKLVCDYDQAVLESCLKMRSTDFEYWTRYI